jgi:hypothetical protein
MSMRNIDSPAKRRAFQKIYPENTYDAEANIPTKE